MRVLPITLTAIVATALGCVGEIPVVPPPGPPTPPVVVPPDAVTPGIPVTSGPALDVTGSTVSATPGSGLVADGLETAEVAVRLVDVTGAPLAGARVLLSVAEGATVTEPPLTDEFGRTAATLTSEVAGDFEVVATVYGINLPSRPVVEFIACLSTEKRFERDILGPLLSQCTGCHNAYGRAPEIGGDPSFAMALPGDTDFAAFNYAWLNDRNFTVSTAEGELPYVLAKPRDLVGEAPHGGGVVLLPDAPILPAFERFLEELDAPRTCPDEVETDLFGSVELMNAPETFKRATFALTGDVLTAAALEAFRAQTGSGNFDDLDNEIDALWTTPAFQARLTEMLNDLYLTDELNTGIRAINQLPNADFPQRFYFRSCTEFAANCCTAGNCCIDDATQDAEFCEGGKDFANESVARGGIEVLREIVSGDLPFTEILQMDSVMVNPYSATVFGLDVAALGFDADPSNDRNEFVRAQIVQTADNGIPADQQHAGVLSTFAFLKRYPTTNTNVNRHRARTVYQKYLDVDVMNFLQLVIDQDEDLGEDPFRDARTCSACHAALDPIAGTFQNWKANGRYVSNGWIASLRPAGFKGELTAEPDIDTALLWLGGELAADERFALATVKQVHKLLTGHDALTLPDNPDIDSYQAELAAFLDQNAYFVEQRDLFISSGYSLREAFKEAIKGRYFRAESWTATDALTDEALRIAGAGIAKAITPEQLRRKLVSLTGYHWTTNNRGNGADNLLNAGRFRLLLGGHDSDEIVARFRDPFPISANVTRRMANEFGCMLASQDLTYVNAADRVLLRGVEKDTVDEQAVRDNLKDLHLLLWGESVTDGDPELEATYALWRDVRAEGDARTDAGDESNILTDRCRGTQDFFTRVTLPAEASPGPDRVQVRSDNAYTVRAWAAVFAYMIADYRFLFE